MRSSPEAFLCAVTADYPAALGVYHFLKRREIECFFADEGLWKIHDSGYGAQSAAALSEASWLIVMVGRSDHAGAAIVREAWRAFEGRRDRRLVVLAEDVGEESLPESFRNSRVLCLPGAGERVYQFISGRDSGDGETKVEAPSRWRAGRRTRVGAWGLTAANVAILMTTVWLAVRNTDVNSGPGVVAEPKRKVGSGALAAGTGKAGLDLVIPWTEGPVNGFYQIQIGQATQSFSYIPPGTFLMGSAESEMGRQFGETPRSVSITNGFWLARTECTQALWQAVTGRNPSRFRESDCPVESVSWDDIALGNECFLVQINEMKLLPEGMRFALPDEAQWEYACRAGTPGAFAFGDALAGSQANFDGRLPYGMRVPGPFVNGIVAVGSYASNEWGLFDMHGNVQEWCAPWPKAATPFDSDGGQVVRGGSWGYTASLCRSASRAIFRGDTGDPTTGFRIAVVMN